MLANAVDKDYISTGFLRRPCLDRHCIT